MFQLMCEKKKILSPGGPDQKCESSPFFYFRVRPSLSKFDLIFLDLFQLIIIIDNGSIFPSREFQEWQHQCPHL